jgi:hypothetical protein
VATSSSSTKKAARLTQRSKGSKVRFQGGTVFPLALAITVVLGLGTIVYARQSQPTAEASQPGIDDHWHAAYGFNICGEWFRLTGDKEEVNAQGQLANTDYLTTGVHSHDDGVIHWHAFTSKAVGNNADLGVFLDVYGIELNGDRLRFPEGQPAIGESGGTAEQEYVEGETQCNGEDAELSVVVWDNFSDTGDGTTYITNFEDIRVRDDGMVFSISFNPRDTDVSMPPWAKDLPVLGAIDSGVVPPLTTEPGTSEPATTEPVTSDTTTSETTGE